MKSVAFVLAGVSIAFATTQATAQTVRMRSAASMTATPTTPSVIVQPFSSVPGWQPNATTIEESWARGLADVIRALDENDLNSSAAAINSDTQRLAPTDN